MGWLGEGQTFFGTANYFMSGAAFYRKWLMDIRDAQKKDGKVSAVVPYVGFEMLYGNNGSSVDWVNTTAEIVLPDGERRLLEAGTYSFIKKEI